MKNYKVGDVFDPTDINTLSVHDYEGTIWDHRRAGRVMVAQVGSYTWRLIHISGNRWSEPKTDQDGMSFIVEQLTDATYVGRCVGFRTE